MTSAAAAIQIEQDHKRLDGKALAREIRASVAEQVRVLKEAGWTPRLVSIAVGETDAAKLYIRNQRRVAEQVGIPFEERAYSESVTQEELLAAIRALNADPRVTGVIIQRPVPRRIAVKELQATVHPLKELGFAVVAAKLPS